jgi:hypothetical protein
MTDEPTRPRRIRRLTTLCSICGAVGVFGGLASLFCGLLCGIIHAVVAEDRVFDRAGTVLLVAAIPMILTGSIFLDQADPKA